MHSRSTGMRFERLGLSVRKKYPAVRTTAAIRSKKNFICQDGRGLQFRIQNYSAFRTAEVFRTAKGIRSDSAFRVALDLPNCHTFCWRIFQIQIYRCTDVKILVVSFTFTAQKSTNKTPKQNFSLDCQVVSKLDTMDFLDIKTLILQSAAFPSNRKCDIELNPSI